MFAFFKSLFTEKDLSFKDKYWADNFYSFFNFQAFDITSKVPESLDHLLAASLEEHMPLNGLQVFGISQIADNTEASTWFHVYSL